MHNPYHSIHRSNFWRLSSSILQHLIRYSTLHLYEFLSGILLAFPLMILMYIPTCYTTCNANRHLIEHPLWHVVWHFLSYILVGILSDIYHDILAFYHILSAISVDIPSGDWFLAFYLESSRNLFDVLFGTSCDALSSGILSGIASAMKRLAFILAFCLAV